MDDVVIHKVEPLKEPRFVRPMQVSYSQDGQTPRKWEYVRVHDSVAILIFNVTLKCLILVKQFRPAVFMHECHRKQEDERSAGQKERSIIDVSKDISPKVAILNELCAGLADQKGKSNEEVAAAEVLEETGYRVAAESLELISKFRSAVGSSGTTQSMFYAEVTEDMKEHGGGGLASEGEMIETFQLPIDQIEPYLQSKDQGHGPGGLLFALMWFQKHKSHLYL